MAARTFEDSSGATWEVFEVHRSSTTAGAVSNGLEKGWLAFVNGSIKRRLAPYPPAWATADVPELERLCRMAREAPAPRYPLDPQGGSERRAEQEGTRRDAAEAAAKKALAGADESVEATVRRFAHEARAQGLPAIEAMVQLKLLLGTHYPEPSSVARDMRRVRRWFVEAFYFEPTR